VYSTVKNKPFLQKETILLDLENFRETVDKAKEQFKLQEKLNIASKNSNEI